jgi:PAS domain S-box-containing protein
MRHPPTGKNIRGGAGRTRRAGTRAANTAQRARMHDMMFDQAAVPLALIGTDHRFIRVNAAWARHHGKDIKDFSGRTYAELFPADTAYIAERARMLDRAIATKKPLRLLGRPFVFANNPERGMTYWDWTLHPLCDERGNVELVLFSSVDATERVRTEQALATRNEHGQSLLRLSRHLEHAQTYKELLDAAFEEVKRIIGYQHLWVYLLTDDRRHADAFIVDGRPFEIDVSRLTIEGDRMLEEIAAARDIVIVEDAQIDPRVNRELVRQLGNRTIVNVPIMLFDRHLGSVGTGTFGDEGVRVPDAPERDFLTAMASHLAVSLDRIHSLDLRRRGEQALKESELRFRSLFEHHDAVMLLIDPASGAIVEANPAAERFYGHPPGTLNRLRIEDLNETTAAEATAGKSNAPRDGGDRSIVRQRLADGRVRTVEIHATAVDVNATRLLFAIVHDITERRQAEHQLALMNVAINNVREAAYLIDTRDGHFQYVNDEACRMLGYAREELVGKRPEDIDPDYAQLAAASPKDKPPIPKALVFEARHRTKDGRLIPVEVSFNIFEYDGQRLNMALVRDISEHKRARTALERVNRALKTLSSGNEALVRGTNEEDLLASMCRVLVETGGYRMAWIGYTEGNPGNALRPVAWGGVGGERLGAESAGTAGALVQHPAGAAVATGTAQVIHDIDGDAAFNASRDAVSEFGYRSCLAVPLRFDAGTLGALTIFSGDAAAFDRDETALMTELADDLAYGIHALRTRREKQRGQEHLQETMEAMIQALASTVEMRDPYTAGHQRNVAKLAVAIAQELGFAPDRTHGLYLAGIVHDVGKIYVPAEVLSRPGRLSAVEYALVQTHVEAGHEILGAIDFPWPIEQIVRQHHERLDGSGYPFGLQGDAIMLEARILAVSDVVEAMSAHRPYRPGRGLAAALAEVERGRQTLYDPAVVDACLTVFREKGFQFD